MIFLSGSPEIPIELSPRISIGATRRALSRVPLSVFVGFSSVISPGVLQRLLFEVPTRVPPRTSTGVHSRISPEVPRRVLSEVPLKIFSEDLFPAISPVVFSRFRSALWDLSWS